MPECKTDERLYKRNHTLRMLKQMLCKLENYSYEKNPPIEPTVLLRAQRCLCGPEKPVKGEVLEAANLDGGEAFSRIIPETKGMLWCPSYPCPNQEMSPDMGCYKSVKTCKDDALCCECEVAEGSHVHLPENRDRSRPLKKQCFADDLCTGATQRSHGLPRSCDPNLNSNRYFPNWHSNCQYPRICPASCFDHHDLNDWAVSKPSYTYYMQSRAFRPF